MEILKWIVSMITAVVGVSLFIVGGFILATFGALISSVLIGLVVVIVIAAGIKEYFDSPETKR